VPGSGSDPQEPIDVNLLSDVPAWLRSLRLHKYQPIFEGSNWKEMVMLDDKALEDKGVSALGARRKLLKCVSYSLLFLAWAHVACLFEGCLRTFGSR
jgi:hypothetical protein